jgi:uncharacterized membrane protein
MKKKIIRSAVLGLLALVASAVAFFILEVCLVQSFWIHAMVFPINPRTVSQPTALTYVGIASQYLCTAFFLGSAFLLLRAAWLFIMNRRMKADA